jgi:hypothetical protein
VGNPLSALRPEPERTTIFWRMAGRYDTGVLEFFQHADFQSLKEIVTIGAIMLTGSHAAVLEICGRTDMGKDRFGRASR